MNEKIIKIQNEMEEKVEALSIEKETRSRYSPNNINQKRIFRNSTSCFSVPSLPALHSFLHHY
jgi:hypothetical protein